MRMRRALSVSVSELGPGEFTARLDQLVAVYAAAMRPPEELLTGRRSTMAGHAVNPGFRALAVTDDGTGETVGFGYGFHGAPGQWWHDTVRRALVAGHGDTAAAAWLRGPFQVAAPPLAPDFPRPGRAAARPSGRRGPRRSPVPRPGRPPRLAAAPTAAPAPGSRRARSPARSPAGWSPA